MRSPPVMWPVTVAKTGVVGPSPTSGLAGGVADLAHDVAEDPDPLAAQDRPGSPLEAGEMAGQDGGETVEPGA
jgi:hypothetical protein